MPKISIIAPVYGVEKYIDQFLESIRNQTFKDLEVILVDDGSPDRCPEILDRFAESDERYRVIHQKNGGVSVARNTGIAAATGEYIYIVDSDDWLTPDAVELLCNKMDETGADIVYGDYILEKEDGALMQQCFSNEFVTENAETIRTLQFAIPTNNHPLNVSADEFSELRHFGGAPWRYMVRTAIIQDNELKYDPYVRGLGDDILFSLHLFEHIKKVAYMQKPIYHYRLMQASYSQGYKANYLESVQLIFDRLEDFLEKYHKDEFIRSAYYARVLLYLDQGMQRYFKNTQNPADAKERYRELKATLRKEPYRTAIKKAPLGQFQSRRFKYSMYMLRYGMTRLYWLVSR